MQSLLQKLMRIELRSAARRNYKRDLWLTCIAVLIFSALSLLAYDVGFFGVLLGVLYCWHRYVVLNVSRGRCTDVSDEEGG